MALSVEIPFLINFDNVREAAAELKKILGLSGDKAGKALSGALNKAAKKVGGSFDDIGKKADGFASSGGKAARAPIPGFALLGEAVAVSGEAIVLLGGPVGIAIAGFGALLSTVTAAASGIVLAGVAIVGLVASSGELEKSIKGLEKLEGFGISKEDSATLESSRAAMSSLTAVIAQGSLEIAAQWAPAIERVTTLLLAFGIAGVDVFQGVRAGVGSFSDLVVKSAQDAVTAYNPFFRQIEKMIGGLERIGAVSKGTAASFRASTNDIVEGLARDAVDGLETSFVALEFAAGDYLRQAEELVDTQVLLNREMTKTKDIKPFLTAAEGFDAIAQAQIEAQELLIGFETDRFSAVQAINAEFEIQKEQILGLIDLGADQVALNKLLLNLDIERNHALSEAQDRTADLETRSQRWVRVMDEGTVRARKVASAVGDAAGGFSQLFDEIATGTKKQMKGLFIASKALAISQIILQGTVATIKAFAQLGPIAGAVAAAGVVAAAVASSMSAARSVSAQFSTGGIANAAGGVVDGGGNPRVPALLEDREGVLNQRAMGILGRSDFQRLNEGANPAARRERSPGIRFRDRELAHMVGRVWDGANELGDRVRGIQGPVGVLDWTV